MSEDKNGASKLTEDNGRSDPRTATGLNRRKFLGTVGTAAAVATGALATPSVAFGQSGSSVPSTPVPPATNKRVLQAFETRVVAATREALIPVPAHATNGDEARYPDKSGTHSKGLLQDG